MLYRDAPNREPAPEPTRRGFYIDTLLVTVALRRDFPARPEQRVELPSRPENIGP